MKRGALGLTVVALALVVAVLGLERWIASSKEHAPPASAQSRAVLERSVRSGDAPASNPAGSSTEPGAWSMRRDRDARAGGMTAAASERAWRGRVVDARTGAAIAGVRIGWVAAGGHLEVHSESDGRFELAGAVAPEGALGRAEFRHARYATAVRPDVDPRIERDWELWPCVAIEGVVRGPAAHAGEPVEVVLWSATGPPDVDPLLRVTTVSSAGAFRFDGLEPGVYALVASTPTAAPTARGGLALGTGRTLTVELELEHGARLEGRVVERTTRAGVGAASVSLAWVGAGLPSSVEERLQRSTTTAEDGRYALQGLAAGEQRAVVRAPWGSRVEQTLNIERSGDRGERDFLVGACATLTGVVRSPQGATVAGARVALFDAEHVAELAGAEPLGRVTSTTAADGSFELVDVPPRERLILIAFPPADSELCASEPRTVDLRPEEERNAVDVELGAGCRLAGRVEDGDGRTIAGAELALAQRSKLGDWDSAAVSTDERGRFEFPPLAAGRAELTVTAAGFAPLRSKVHLRADRELDEIVRLRAATTVAGCAVDADGWGVPYTQVRLRRIGPAPPGAPRRETLREVADEFGAFRFDAVPEGRWTPQAALDGWAVERVEPAELVTPGALDLRFELNPDLRRSVVVHGSVVVDGRDEPRALALAGIAGVKVIDGGRFTISGMAPGRSKLVVRARGALPRTVRLDLSGGGEIDVGVIELVHGTELSVRLTGPDRRPVRKAAVRLEPAREPPQSRRGRYGVPTALELGERKAGQYGERPVLPGRWRVLVEAPGYAPVEQSIRVRDKQRQVVPIALER